MIKFGFKEGTWEERKKSFRQDLHQEVVNLVKEVEKELFVRRVLVPMRSSNKFVHSGPINSLVGASSLSDLKKATLFLNTGKHWRKKDTSPLKVQLFFRTATLPHSPDMGQKGVTSTIQTDTGAVTFLKWHTHWANKVDQGIRPHNIRYKESNRLKSLFFFWQKQNSFFMGPFVRHPGIKPRYFRRDIEQDGKDYLMLNIAKLLAVLKRRYG